MTTILACVKEGVMVSDSRCSADGVWYPMTKIWRLPGELVGMAGDVKSGRAWLKWYANGKKGARPKLENFIGLSLRADGLYDIGSDGLELLVERGYHGIGSGGNCALAAYMAGAKPLAAVEIACAIDLHSGGKIVVEKLKK